MWQYFIVLACVIALVLIRIFLFNKSYQNKLKYYADPEQLGRDFLENMTKNQSEIQISNMINNFKALMEQNLKRIEEALQQIKAIEDSKSIKNVQKEKLDKVLEVISEKMRNICIIISIIKIRYQSDKTIMNKKYSDLVPVVFPKLSLFTQIRIYCNEKINVKNIEDKAMKLTLEKYNDYISGQLTPYLFPY